MKRITKRLLRLKTRLFERTSQVIGIRYQALSIWLGISGGEMPSSLVRIPIRRRRS
jgi:hypothetical protein